jgi:uncharacterized protein
MSIDWTNFTPWSALVGGLLIGLATAIYLLGVGRVAGISGIVAGPLSALRGVAAWGAQRQRLAFIAGLLLAPALWRVVAPLPAMTVDVGQGWVLVAGLLVGVGTRMGNGCTSGHGVCGLSRLSLRSLVNVLVFMAAGVVTVAVLHHAF